MHLFGLVTIMSWRDKAKSTCVIVRHSSVGLVQRQLTRESGHCQSLAIGDIRQYFMFSKLLLTLAVIVAAFTFVRRRNRAAASTSPPIDKKPENTVAPIPGAATVSSDLRLAAYLFLALVIGLGASMYYYQYQDDHTVLNVTLFRDGSNSITYQVYKFQLGTRSFTTLDGLSVTVASSERMVVDGLAAP